MVGLKLRPYTGGGTPYTFKTTTFFFCCLTQKKQAAFYTEKK